MFDPVQAVLIGLALALGAAMQGAIGFAFGLVSIPLLVWSGVSMPRAVAMVLAMVMVQTTGNLWKLRAHLDFHGGWAMTVYRVVSMAVGVYLMAWLVGLGPDRVKQAIGGLIGLALLAQWIGRVTPRKRVHSVWTPIVGLSSGLMSGTVGMGGPPLVMWVMAHDWSTERARCFLWLCFLILMPVQLALMVWKFGGEAAWGMPIGLAYTPVVILASMGGAAVGSRLNRKRLRVAAYGVLAVIAGVSIAAPLWRA